MSKNGSNQKGGYYDVSHVLLFSYDAVATNIAIQGSFGLQEHRYWASKVSSKQCQFMINDKNITLKLYESPKIQ